MEVLPDGRTSEPARLQQQRRADGAGAADDHARLYAQLPLWLRPGVQQACPDHAPAPGARLDTLGAAVGPDAGAGRIRAGNIGHAHALLGIVGTAENAESRANAGRSAREEWEGLRHS